MPSDERPLEVGALHEEHADFVWRSLQRMGVADGDLEDVLQEVFVVVHRRLRSFDGSSSLRTWLFGICLKLASQYRRRAHRVRERSMAVPPEDRAAQAPSTPEEVVARREAQAQLASILDRMDLRRRAVLVMFEIEGLSCGQIAAALEIPIGTVYSRLNAARAEFKQLVERSAAAGKEKRRARA